MSAFESFVNLELPRRSAHLTVAITGYDGDPNDPGAPASLQNAPQGTWYQRETPENTWYRKQVGGAGGSTSWVIPGGTLSTPGTTTDNAVVRWDGTDGGAIQDSGVTVSDTNDLTVPGDLLSPGSGGATSFKAGAGATAIDIQSVAIGQNALARSDGVAIGFNAVNSAADGVAVGLGATTPTQAVAVGQNAAPGTSGVAIGMESGGGGATGGVQIGKQANNVQVTTGYGVAVGYETKAYKSSVALGFRAGYDALNGPTLNRSADLAVLIGNQANAEDNTIGCVSIGYTATSGTTSNYAIAIGHTATVGASSANAISIGYLASATAAGAVSLGYTTSAVGVDSVVIGYDASSLSAAVQGVAIGREARAAQAYGVGIGYQSDAQQWGVAVGYSTFAGSSSVALGYDATTTSNGVAIGYLASASVGGLALGWSAAGLDSNAISVGFRAKSAAGTVSIGAAVCYDIALPSDARQLTNSVMIGASATGTNLKTECVAVGYTALVEDDRATAIGSQADVGSADAIAIGYTADVSTTAVGAVAIGSAATVGASSGGSIAIGQSTSAAGADSVVIGNAATSGDVDNVVVGANASAPGFRNVAIGESAVGGNDAGDLYNVVVGWTASATDDEGVAVGAQATNTSPGGVAVGFQAQVLSGSVAVGKSAFVNGGSSIAIGATTNAIGGAGICIGGLSRSTVNSVGLGYQAKAYTNSVAVGFQAGYQAGATLDMPTAQQGVFIGYGSRSADGTTGCIAIGYTALSAANYSVTIGYTASASGSRSVVIGGGASAPSAQSVVIGDGASGGVGVTIGYNSTTTFNSAAIGNLATATSNAVAIGAGANGQSGSVAVGYDTRTTSGDSVAVGERANAVSSSVAIGRRAGMNDSGTRIDVASSVFIGAQTWGTVLQTGAIGIGYQARALSAWSIAIGYQTSVPTSRNDSIQIGRSTTTTGSTAIAVGYFAQAAQRAVAIGDQADASGLYGISIGYLSGATTNGIAIGQSTSAASSNGIAIGSDASADFSRSISIGDTAVAVAAQSVAVGALSRVGNNGALLGQQARAHTDAVAIGYQAGYDVAYTNATPLAASAVMIGRQALAADGKTGAIAIGQQSQSMANYSIAIGHSAEVLSDLIYQPTNTVGIGYNIALAPQSEFSVYIGDNVQAIDTKGVAATGSITVVAGSLLIDGETVVLNDGTNPAVTFEFDSNGSVVETNTLRAVNFTAGDTANTVANSLFAAIFNAPVLDITPVLAAPTVNLTNDRKYLAGNQTITDTVADGGFTTTGMSGGANQAWTGENVGIGSGVTMKGGGNVCIGTWSAMGTGEAYGVTMVGYNINADYTACDYSTFIGSDINAAVDCSDNVCIGTGISLQSGCAFNTTVGPYNYFGTADCANSVVLSWNGSVGDNTSGAVTNAVVLGYNSRVLHDYSAVIGTNMQTQRANICMIGPQSPSQYMDLQCSGAIRAGGNPLVSSGGALQVGDERIVQNFQATATTGGSLVNGTHTYYISATLPSGESYRTITAKFASIINPTTNRAALSWDPFAGAIGYTIYAKGGTFGSTWNKRAVTGTAFDHDDYVTGWTATSERFQGSGDFLSTADAVRFTANTPDSFFGLFCNNGVGTDSPTEKLDVAGTLKVRGDAINNGQETLVKTVTTVLSSLSGATATATNLIPAGAVVVGVTTRVTSAVSGATSFDVGDGTDVDAFGAAIAVALDTTSDNTDWTITSIPIYPTATSVVLTANGSSFTGGIVRVSVHYIAVTAPTS